MTIEKLTSRAIVGEFYHKLTTDPGAAWIDPISMLFNSNQGSEEYAWLGQSPVMKEWVGGRNTKGFRENSFTIKNLHFEATMEVLKHELRRDKTGQVMVRIRELATRTNAHWASLLSTLVLNGASALCYDGQYFFDTDHSEGDSGTQSNSISSDISAIPAQVRGVPASPSAEEMRGSIMKGVAQILGFVDDQGEPMNENARSFLVQVPISLYQVAVEAVAPPAQTSGPQVGAIPPGFGVSVAANTRLNSWTDKFAVFRTDGDVKPFIRQQETEVELSAIAEGSELEFNEGKHRYGVDVWRNVAYGYWQHACLVTMI